MQNSRTIEQKCRATRATSLAPLPGASVILSIATRQRTLLCPLLAVLDVGQCVSKSRLLLYVLWSVSQIFATREVKGRAIQAPGKRARRPTSLKLSSSLLSISSYPIPFRSFPYNSRSFSQLIPPHSSHKIKMPGLCSAVLLLLLLLQGACAVFTPTAWHSARQSPSGFVHHTQTNKRRQTPTSQRAPSIEESRKAIDQDSVWIVELNEGADVQALDDLQKRGLNVSQHSSIVSPSWLAG